MVAYGYQPNALTYVKLVTRPIWLALDGTHKKIHPHAMHSENNMVETKIFHWILTLNSDQ